MTSSEGSCGPEFVRRDFCAFGGRNPVCCNSIHEARNVQVTAVPQKRRDALQRADRTPRPYDRVCSDVLMQVGIYLVAPQPREPSGARFWLDGRCEKYS